MGINSGAAYARDENFIPRLSERLAPVGIMGVEFKEQLKPVSTDHRAVMFEEFHWGVLVISFVSLSDGCTPDPCNSSSRGLRSPHSERFCCQNVTHSHRAFTSC